MLFKYIKRNTLTIIVVASVLLSLLLIAFIYYASKDWTATGTVALACFGALGTILSYITLDSMKRDKRPYVFVDLVRESLSSSILQVELKNYGNMPAHNLQIIVEPPECENDLLKEGVIFRKMSELSIIKHPIRFLAIGESIIARFGTALGMSEFIPKIIYEVRVDYEDSSGRKYYDSLVLDPSYLINTPIMTDPVSSELKEIDKTLKKTFDIIKHITESQRIQSGELGYCRIHNHAANPVTGKCIECRSIEHFESEKVDNHKKDT